MVSCWGSLEGNSCQKSKKRCLIFSSQSLILIYYIYVLHVQICWWAKNQCIINNDEHWLNSKSWGDCSSTGKKKNNFATNSNILFSLIIEERSGNLYVFHCVLLILSPEPWLPTACGAVIRQHMKHKATTPCRNITCSQKLSGTHRVKARTTIFTGLMSQLWIMNFLVIASRLVC